MHLQNAPMMSLSQVKAFGQEEAEFILVDLHSKSYQHELKLSRGEDRR